MADNCVCVCGDRANAIIAGDYLAHKSIEIYLSLPLLPTDNAKASLVPISPSLPLSVSIASPPTSVPLGRCRQFLWQPDKLPPHVANCLADTYTTTNVWVGCEMLQIE